MATGNTNMYINNSPFNLENDSLYQQWRDRKLENYPTQLGDLVVELKNTRELSKTEHDAILQRCQQSNMALYAGNTGDDPDRNILLSLGQQFGLKNLDYNWLGDDDGLTSLTVADASDNERRNYIPYSNRPIKWHTDGYYNTADKQIHGLLLHCVQHAMSGGKNALMDHEVAYILLREQSPDYIRLLMQDDVMIIPARTDTKGNIVRKEESGPIFSIDAQTGNLHMRYTIRTHNIIWKDEPQTREALNALTDILNSDSPYIYHGLLEPGMGLISNNVLHDRSAFEDNESQRRLLYRARYYDRITGTDVC